MVWGGRWERGSGLGTRVHPWWIHVDIWQNQYSIVKQNKGKKERKKNTELRKTLKHDPFLYCYYPYVTLQMKLSVSQAQPRP